MLQQKAVVLSGLRVRQCIGVCVHEFVESSDGWEAQGLLMVQGWVAVLPSGLSLLGTSDSLLAYQQNTGNYKILFRNQKFISWFLGVIQDVQALETHNTGNSQVPIDDAYA